MRRVYPIVNDSDRIIGYKDKEQAYRDKSMLRSIQIFVYNPKGELFVQKRGKHKTRFPNYYCASVAGHVELKETYRQAAIRELKEELGIKTNNLKKIGKQITPVGNNTFAMMYMYTVTTDAPITLLQEEIDGGKFYPIQRMRQLIRKKKLFTTSFLHLFRYLYDKKNRNK